MFSISNRVGKANDPSSLITVWYQSVQSQETRKKSFIRGKKINLSYCTMALDSLFYTALKTVFDRNKFEFNLTNSSKGWKFRRIRYLHVI